MVQRLQLSSVTYNECTEGQKRWSLLGTLSGGRNPDGTNYEGYEVQHYMEEIHSSDPFQ